MYTQECQNAQNPTLDTLKICFENAEFNFKKFDVSSEKVAKIIEEQMQWKDKKQVGLGYESVPPPFNHTYIPTPLTQEEIDREPYMIYGKPAAEQATGPSARVFDTNISTSNTDVSVSQGKQGNEKSESSKLVSMFGVPICDEYVSNVKTDVFFVMM